MDTCVLVRRVPVPQTREEYCRLLEEALSRNLHTCLVAAGAVAGRVPEVAVDLEYGVFSANRVVTLYRRAMALMVRPTHPPD